MSFPISDADGSQTATRLDGGELLAGISRRIVQLLARHAGKGPTRCKTHWAGPDMLVVVLGGGYTEAERTLYERGRADEVRAYRSAIQEVLREDMSGEVEELTGRGVVAFMSTSHQDPDLLVEIFVLEPLEEGASITDITPPRTPAA
ncbi:MAG TPA: Na-translocating system protein MpsC family protein [Thermoleophilaceae bacterium]|jgi:uncharacterized protein YbcI